MRAVSQQGNPTLQIVNHGGAKIGGSADMHGIIRSRT
jgi:hypothetical protein